MKPLIYIASFIIGALVILGVVKLILSLIFGIVGIIWSLVPVVIIAAIVYFIWRILKKA